MVQPLYFLLVLVFALFSLAFVQLQNWNSAVSKAESLQLALMRYRQTHENLVPESLESYRMAGYWHPHSSKFKSPNSLAISEHYTLSYVPCDYHINYQSGKSEVIRGGFYLLLTGPKWIRPSIDVPVDLRKQGVKRVYSSEICSYGPAWSGSTASLPTGLNL
jgi:hypothetical protein